MLYEKLVLNSAMKPAAPPVLRAARLLDQVRERIRYKHYSLRTEQAYGPVLAAWLNYGFGASSWMAAQGPKSSYELASNP